MGPATRDPARRDASALFSATLLAADDTDEARKPARDYLDDVEDDSGWTPRLRASFAGALQYREYECAAPVTGA